MLAVVIETGGSLGSLLSRAALLPLLALLLSLFHSGLLRCFFPNPKKTGGSFSDVTSRQRGGFMVDTDMLSTNSVMRSRLLSCGKPGLHGNVD